MKLLIKILNNKENKLTHALNIVINNNKTKNLYRKIILLI